MKDISEIYHITTTDQWQKALEQGQYVSETFDEEGFIHFSLESQVLDTANRYYSGTLGLVLLKVNTSKLAAVLKYETSTSGEEFPHLYGPLNLDSVDEVFEFSASQNGEFLMLPF